MRKFFIVIGLSVLLAFIGITRVYAVGLGPFIESGSGSGDWETSYDDLSTDNYSTSVDTSSLSFGFVLDTAPRDSKVFNYRLNISYDMLEIENSDSDSGKLELDGVAIDNTFGFSVFRNKNMRFWLGPQIRLAFYTGSDDYTAGSTEWSADYALFAFGLGPVFGANFGMGPAATVSITTGYRFLGYAGIESITSSGYYSVEEDNDITISGGMGFLNVSFLFGK